MPRERHVLAKSCGELQARCGESVARGGGFGASDEMEKRSRATV
jgi:hypothetical protein